MYRFPCGLSRVVPERMTCTTLVAVGSLTARAPVRFAWSSIGLVPLHPWQLTQAPSYISLPRGSTVAATPMLWSGGAGEFLTGGRSRDLTGGTVATYAAKAETSPG